MGHVVFGVKSKPIKKTAVSDKLSKRTGAPLAELLRRAVAMYLKAPEEKMMR